MTTEEIPTPMATEIEQAAEQYATGPEPSLVSLDGLVEAFHNVGLDIPRKTLRQWAVDGKIPSLMYAGRRRLFCLEAVERAVLRLAGL